MATTTLVVELLQLQLQLPQAESALAAAVKLHETHVAKFSFALAAALFGCLKLCSLSDGTVVLVLMIDG